jgi:hypothetical protein
MTRRVWLLAGLATEATCLAIDVPRAGAQAAWNEGQGHPLKGVWIGTWGVNKTARTDVLIEMNWDGKVVTATLNPGAGGISFTKAELDHTNWSVHLETTAAGVRYLVDGTIENLGSNSRSIVGTWVQGNQKGDFKITRQ